MTTDLIALGLDLLGTAWMTYHNTTDSVWQPSTVYANVSDAADGGNFFQMSCAGFPDGNLHVVTLNHPTQFTGNVWHTMRDSSGTWDDFGDIMPYIDPQNQLHPGTCSCCSEGGDSTTDGILHICGLGSANSQQIIWYTNRNGSNWLQFESVTLPSDNGGTPNDVRCTVSPNGDVHLILATTTGLWHTYREDGQWGSYDQGGYPISSKAIPDSVAIAMSASKQISIVGQTTSGRTFYGSFDTTMGNFSATIPRFDIPGCPNVGSISCSLSPEDQNLYVGYSTPDGVLKYAEYSGVLPSDANPTTIVNLNESKASVPGYFKVAAIAAF